MDSILERVDKKEMNEDSIRQPDEMNESRKNTLIKTIEIRLEGVRESSKRARLAFLVATIASAAILVTIWTAYFSWTRAFVFPDVPPEVKEKYAGMGVDLPCDEYGRILAGEAQKQKEMLQGGERVPLSLREFNKRNAAAEWIKALSVSIDPLGIDVNVNDFAIIGSVSFVIISLWFLFSVRRENRAIVTLLRDIYDETQFTPEDKGNNRWDIANLAFQGAAHSLVFISVGNDDRPMSGHNVFGNPTKYSFLDGIVGRLTTFVRYLAVLLMLLPAFTIFAIVYADYWSIGQCSPLRPDFSLLQNALTAREEYIYRTETLISLALGVLTFMICLVGIIFQRRTTDALFSFAKQLGMGDVIIRPENEEPSD